MTKEQIDQMVSAFLCWKLPQTFNPDCYISFAPKPDFRGYPPTWPVGTNLFSYTEAKAMVEHMVAALSPAPTVPPGFKLVPVELNFDLVDAFFDAWESEKDRMLNETGSYAEARMFKVAWKALLNSSAILAASPQPPVVEGFVAVPKDALDALYMRLWHRHEHAEDGEPVHRPWTPEDDAALKGIAKYLFPAPPAPETAYGNS